jgi:hypothetical protein
MVKSRKENKDENTKEFFRWPYHSILGLGTVIVNPGMYGLFRNTSEDELSGVSDECSRGAC